MRKQIALNKKQMALMMRSLNARRNEITKKANAVSDASLSTLMMVEADLIQELICLIDQTAKEVA